jgi:hypothetical protein
MEYSIEKQMLAERGISFPYASGFIGENLAQDAALATAPNLGVPVELTAYIDPEVVPILTAARNAREIFRDRKVGDWTTPYMRFPLEEITGSTQPYSDDANGITTDVNMNWPSREQYVFQTTMRYGDREQAMTAQAKIDLAGRKQQAAARIIEIDSNKFRLLGVAGKSIYGLLNDPNLPAATALGTAWTAATADTIYNDILTKLYGKIAERSGSLVTPDSNLVIACSPAVMTKLGTSSTYGITTLDMLKQYFSNLKVVSLPECESVSGGDHMYMIATDILGARTAEYPFGMLFEAGRVVPRMSSFEQKFKASTYGCLVYYPFAIASITGMTA